MSEISELLDSLHRGKSPGLDGITAEHLQYGKSQSMCEILADLFSLMLSRGCVPSVFHTGIIIPILKKATLDPNEAKNYRPVTVSSVYAELCEMTLVPEVNISDNQFGFREKRGTDMACNMLNDIISHCKEQDSPLYIASRDAEKCFDTVKLKDVIAPYEWIFLYEWYCNLNAYVKWNGSYSDKF